jgi:hypothetical protein
MDWCKCDRGHRYPCPPDGCYLDVAGVRAVDPVDEPIENWLYEVTQSAIALVALQDAHDDRATVGTLADAGLSPAAWDFLHAGLASLDEPVTMELVQSTHLRYATNVQTLDLGENVLHFYLHALPGLIGSMPRRAGRSAQS